MATVTPLTRLSHGSNHNRPTQYEVEVVIDGETMIAGYTARKTKMALLTVAMDNESIRNKMLEALPLNDDSSPTYGNRTWTLGNSVIRWSSGTLRHPTAT